MGAAQPQPSLFGLNISADAARLIVLPIPWEGTVSFRHGTSQAPKAVIELSHQIDHYDPTITDAEKLGIAATPLPSFIEQLNQRAIELRETAEPTAFTAFVNTASAEILRWIDRNARYWLERGKTVALLGGEHSITPALVQALSRYRDRFSILHLDAHADLRRSYENLTYSHATAMYHCLQYDAVDRLVSVGVRDYSEEEARFARQHSDRIRLFHAWDLHEHLFRGTSWDQLCDTIIDGLSSEVYISFDIDVLTLENCPQTGTPVPGGLTYMQALYLIQKVQRSGRRIIGFDLVEIGYDPSNSLDAIVAAHLLYRLANLTIISNGPVLQGSNAPN